MALHNKCDTSSAAERGDSGRPHPPCALEAREFKGLAMHEERANERDQGYRSNERSHAQVGLLNAIPGVPRDVALRRTQRINGAA